MFNKKEFIESTRKLLDAGCFTGRSNGLEQSMRIFCNAFEADKEITETLDVYISPWTKSETSTSSKMTVNEAWEFLCKGMIDIGPDYKGTMKGWFEEEFVRNPDSYSNEVRKLWCAIFSEQTDPILISKLTNLNFLFFVDEIKETANLIAQAYRTSPDTYFQFFKKDYFLSEVAHQLEPTLEKVDAANKMKNAISDSEKTQNEMISKRPFSYFHQVISFEPDKGTYVDINASHTFKEWLFKRETGVAYKFGNGWTVFKKDDNHVAINQGIGTQGVVVTNREDSLRVCNNIVSDKSNQLTFDEKFKERKANLQNALVQLYSMGINPPKRASAPLPSTTEPQPENQEECRIM
jgi:hypothetical protein